MAISIFGTKNEPKKKTGGTGKTGTTTSKSTTTKSTSTSKSSVMSKSDLEKIQASAKSSQSNAGNILKNAISNAGSVAKPTYLTKVDNTNQSAPRTDSVSTKVDNTVLSAPKDLTSNAGSSENLVTSLFSPSILSDQRTASEKRNDVLNYMQKIVQPSPQTPFPAQEGPQVPLSNGTPRTIVMQDTKQPFENRGAVSLFLNQNPNLATNYQGVGNAQPLDINNNNRQNPIGVIQNPWGAGAPQGDILNNNVTNGVGVAGAGGNPLGPGVNFNDWINANTQTVKNNQMVMDELLTRIGVDPTTGEYDPSGIPDPRQTNVSFFDPNKNLMNQGESTLRSFINYGNTGDRTSLPLTVSPDIVDWITQTGIAQGEELLAQMGYEQRLDGSWVRLDAAQTVQPQSQQQAGSGSGYGIGYGSRYSGGGSGGSGSSNSQATRNSGIARSNPVNWRI